MLARISCPACHNQFSIPEGDMGTRQVCGKCHSPFIAGKAMMEPQGAGNAQGNNKTMLGNTAPAIKYNCPRCQAPLEAMSIEAGTKKSCPACAQRISLVDRIVAVVNNEVVTQSELTDRIAIAERQLKRQNTAISSAV